MKEVKPGYFKMYVQNSFTAALNIFINISYSQVQECGTSCAHVSTGIGNAKNALQWVYTEQEIYTKQLERNTGSTAIYSVREDYKRQVLTNKSNVLNKPWTWGGKLGAGQIRNKADALRITILKHSGILTTCLPVVLSIIVMYVYYENEVEERTSYYRIMIASILTLM